MKTPYELGNGNETATHDEAISFYKELAHAYRRHLWFGPVGETDVGVPLHCGVLSRDGVFSPAELKAQGRTIFFLNNGIHPGEPEGVDATMALVRDLVSSASGLERLGNCALVFVPIYNVDGALNRNNTSRVNQDGPASFGFRGNARHLDLNRDFVKCDSRNARSFNALFTRWDPDILVDTHTSNGADYPYTMTLIATQPDKLGGDLGTYLRHTILPALYSGMEARGWPMCPYVNTRKDTPDDGLVDFLDTPRFSTGYAALHQVPGFMPETHMLKPFKDRVASMRALLDTVLEFSASHGAELQALRRRVKEQDRVRKSWPIQWTLDEGHPSTFHFKGYAARHSPSKLGTYQRLSYDRSAPWEKDIPYFNRFLASAQVETPRAYIIPQAWAGVVERLKLNGVEVRSVTVPATIPVQAWRILSATGRPAPFEGRHLHAQVEVASEALQLQVRAGDHVVWCNQEHNRFVVETLEPHAMDSFFRWNFFDSVLQRKETFSDYVFEDEAERLLQEEPGLKAGFEAWKKANPALLGDVDAVLGWIFTHCAHHQEPEHMRYPIYRLVDANVLLD